MFYLISQVLLILLIATILGVLVGWIMRKIKAMKTEEKLRERLRQTESTIDPIKQALSQAQGDIAGRDSSIAALQTKIDTRNPRAARKQRRCCTARAQ